MFKNSIIVIKRQLGTLSKIDLKMIGVLFWKTFLLDSLGVYRFTPGYLKKLSCTLKHLLWWVTMKVSPVNNGIMTQSSSQWDLKSQRGEEGMLRAQRGQERKQEIQTTMSSIDHFRQNLEDLCLEFPSKRPSPTVKGPVFCLAPVN